VESTGFTVISVDLSDQRRSYRNRPRLTPDGRSEWDGLLMASDVAALEMDADPVILSAGNTAAPDGGTFADGFSGLARAFLHAGARSLLVSNWSIASEATVELTTGFLTALRESPNVSRWRLYRFRIGRSVAGGGQAAVRGFWRPPLRDGEMLHPPITTAAAARAGTPAKFIAFDLLPTDEPLLRCRFSERQAALEAFARRVEQKATCVLKGNPIAETARKRLKRLGSRSRRHRD
jgi:hypothetical protein